MLFGHFGEILLLILVGLLVFGPKRIVEMGSQLGKALREFRKATGEMDWSFLSQTDTRPKNSPLSQLSQFSQSLSNLTTPDTQPAPAPQPEATVVDSAPAPTPGEQSQSQP